MSLLINLLDAKNQSLMAIAFMGYVLPFGQMSFWGATVITNLLSPFPSLIEWLCGGHYVYNPCWMVPAKGMK